MKKDKKLILVVRQGFYITKEDYLAIISDIHKWFNKEDIIVYNKPKKIMRNKGILIRMGKGIGKYKTEVIKLNTNMNLLTLYFTEADFYYVTNLLLKNIIRRHRYFSLGLIIMNNL